MEEEEKEEEEEEKEEETVFDQSPKRKHLRENATTNQRKQAKTMYQRAKKLMGETTR